MTKNSFIVYYNYREKLQNLTDAQVGKLFRAMLNYAIDGKEPQLNGVLDMAFQFIKVTMDEDKQKYNDKCNKNKENIKQRWNTNEYERIKKIRTNTNDTDNDNDNNISLSINKNNLSMRARACACEKETEEFLQEHFKNYFNYWGYDEKDKQTFNEVIHILANAIERAKNNNLKFYQMTYSFDLLIQEISKLDEQDIRDIVWQVFNNNSIRDRFLYILGALLSRASEKNKNGSKI